MENISRRKCVLLVLDTSHGQMGGTEQNTLHFAQALAGRGYESILLEVGQAILHKSPASLGLTLLNIPTEHFSDIGMSQWRDIIKKTQPIVVMRSKTWIGCINWRLDLVVSISKIPYLSWEHHPAALVRKGLSDKALRNPLQLKRYIRNQLHLKAVRHSVAVSNAVKDPLVQGFSVPESKVDVIYPGVDFDRFSYDDSARKEIRADWNIPETAFVIGSIGRLVAHKGNDFTLNIMAALRKQDQNTDVWCVIAGKGPDLARLQTLADTLGISDRVRFPGWQKSASRSFSALDVFLMPSADEGLGMTLIEAVACGCLPVGAAIGGMTEILCGPLKRYSLPPADICVWVQAISELLVLPPPERTDLHQQAYSHLRRRFDAKTQWQLMVDWQETHTVCN